MPVVPAARQSQFQVVQGGRPQVEPKFLAMSAAMMHAQGRLFKPPKADPAVVVNPKKDKDGDFDGD